MSSFALTLLLSLTLQGLQPALAPPPPSPYAFYSDVFGQGVTDPDAGMSISQLVESRGFALEHYSVVTSDGYLLTVHRIVPQHYRPAEYLKTRRPILVQHGLFGASTDFLINSPHLHSPNSTYGDNFGFALLQTGRYDVWLANSRGNEYSQEHLQWRADEHTQEMEVPEYWNFSFDQMAAYDLPVVIEKILEVTGAPTLGFVGYSQGATAMFALLSTNTSYASLIRPFVAWAPVVYLSHISSPFRYLAPMTDFLRHLGNRFVPSSAIISSISHPLCRLLTLESLCTNALFLFGGFDLEHLNRTRLATYFHFTPATASTWQIVHYLQLINSHRFTAFNYGSEAANKAHYGADHPTPPEYPLHRIPASMPMMIVRSSNDYLSSIPDTDRLIAELRSRSEEAAANVHSYLVPDPVWAHLDFPLGTEAGSLVYDPTIEFLDRYYLDL